MKNAPACPCPPVGGVTFLPLLASDVYEYCPYILDKTEGNVY